MNSKAKYAKTILPIRCTVEFSRVCRFQSERAYPVANASGPKASAARFVKQATIEKLIRLGLNRKYMESLL